MTPIMCEAEQEQVHQDPVLAWCVGSSRAMREQRFSAQKGKHLSVIAHEAPKHLIVGIEKGAQRVRKEHCLPLKVLWTASGGYFKLGQTSMQSRSWVSKLPRFPICSVGS